MTPVKAAKNYVKFKNLDRKRVRSDLRVQAEAEESEPEKDAEEFSGIQDCGHACMELHMLISILRILDHGSCTMNACTLVSLVFACEKIPNAKRNSKASRSLVILC